jgi:hypothetical protein
MRLQDPLKDAQAAVLVALESVVVRHVVKAQQELFRARVYV